MPPQVIEFITTVNPRVVFGVLAVLTLTALWAVPAHRRGASRVAYARCLPAGAAFPITIAILVVPDNPSAFTHAWSVPFVVLIVLLSWLPSAGLLSMVAEILAGGTVGPAADPKSDQGLEAHTEFDEAPTAQRAETLPRGVRPRGAHATAAPHPAQEQPRKPTRDEDDST